MSRTGHPDFETALGCDVARLYQIGKAMRLPDVTSTWSNCFDEEQSMPNVTEYNYQFHGGPSGYQANRCVLRLKNGNTSVAYVHFIPEGQPIPPDTDTGPWIRMYMPESMILAVVDQLRNEGPIQVYYAAGSGFLLTGNEPIGEAEE